MNLIRKIIFFWKRPKIIVVTDGNLQSIKKIAAQILNSSLKVEKEVLFVNDVENENFYKKEYLIFNLDRGSVRKTKEMSDVKVLTFGFQEGADLQASDLRQNGGTNFKINYQGKIIPIWLGPSGREEIYSVLTAVAIGVVLGLNLVEISQTLTPVTK